MTSIHNNAKDLRGSKVAGYYIDNRALSNITKEFKNLSD